MSHVVNATYEDGQLKLDRALPLQAREKVRVTVESLCDTGAALDAVRQTYGIISWSGDAETLDQLVNDIEFDILEFKCCR